MVSNEFWEKWHSVWKDIQNDSFVTSYWLVTKFLATLKWDWNAKWLTFWVTFDMRHSIPISQWTLGLFSMHPQFMTIFSHLNFLCRVFQNNKCTFRKSVQTFNVLECENWTWTDTEFISINTCLQHNCSIAKTSCVMVFDKCHNWNISNVSHFHEMSCLLMLFNLHWSELLQNFLAWIVGHSTRHWIALSIAITHWLCQTSMCSKHLPWANHQRCSS